MKILALIAALALAPTAFARELPGWEAVVAAPPELHVQFDARRLQHTHTPQQRVQRASQAYRQFKGDAGHPCPPLPCAEDRYP